MPSDELNTHRRKEWRTSSTKSSSHCLIAFAPNRVCAKHWITLLSQPKRNWRWYVRLPMATVNPPESLSILLLWYCETGVRDIYSFISLMYLDLYRKLKHIGVGKLITAVPVDKETEDRIRSAAAHILHAQMELETVVDPSIEGGFIFDINDYRLDASIATQLKRVKQQFIDKNRRIV